MSGVFDLDRYFERIGYSGDRTPTLETLRGIHLAHAQTIPFENLNPFLKRPVLLDVDSLQRKLVHERRGGYCFEQNLLLQHALDSLGFRTTGLAARVMWMLPDGTATPRSHMLLRVDVGHAPGNDSRVPGPDSFLADVGFGGLTLTAPLRLALDVEQQTPHESFRLRAVESFIVMEASVAGSWRALYRFTLEAQLRVDYEVTNWYLWNHPESRFVLNLIAARAQPRHRYALLNSEFATHELNGPTTRRSLTSVRELRDTLETVFGINVPRGDDVDAALGRVMLQPA